ncbi:UNVERIFIED_CONTAM: hypothetical protein Sangu_2592700 [Sesamum angustifolium]|uniref:Endonuclease/exonuclease/phosphatase domain-containing protein n=1 Tax=Sesamum angustifolium TaxID=2727405 RepID=A0AAW2J7E6_9LAMI
MACPTAKPAMKPKVSVYVQCKVLENRTEPTTAPLLEEVNILSEEILEQHSAEEDPVLPSRDNGGKGNHIWIAQDYEVLDVESLDVGTQFIHYHYITNVVVGRRLLWQALSNLVQSIDEELWLFDGDFNAVLDMGEVCGASGDIKQAMDEFQECVVETDLITLPMQGELFTWLNCSSDNRGLWKRLDHMFVNDRLLGRWLNASYVSLTPRTSDHSPLVKRGDTQTKQVSMFRFDNYLALSPEFIPIVKNIGSTT